MIVKTSMRNAAIMGRVLAGETQVSIARDYGVTRQAINAVVRRIRRQLAMVKKTGARSSLVVYVAGNDRAALLHTES